MQVYAYRNGGPNARLGLIVGRRELPRAVDRNRARRMLRESFRKVRARLGGWDVVVRLRGRRDRAAVDAVGAEFAQLLRALDNVE